MFNLTLNDFYSAETQITFYLFRCYYPMMIYSDVTKSDVRNDKDVVSFISHL
jgi:hypothetical protein